MVYKQTVIYLLCWTKTSYAIQQETRRQFSTWHLCKRFLRVILIICVQCTGVKMPPLCNVRLHCTVYSVQRTGQRVSACRAHLGKALKRAHRVIPSRLSLFPTPDRPAPVLTLSFCKGEPVIYSLSTIHFSLHCNQPSSPSHHSLSPGS